MKVRIHVNNAIFEIDAQDVAVYVIIWPIIVITGVLFISFALWFSHTSRQPHERVITSIDELTQRVVRRHSRHGGVHTMVDTDDTTILPAIQNGALHSHWAISNEPWHESHHPADAMSHGRRSADNPHRTIVPSDWQPPVGERRIALIGDETVEINKDSWRSAITRPYVTVNA